MARIRLHYNPLCTPCRNKAAWVHRLDWLGRIEISTTPPEEGIVPAGKVAVRDLKTGVLYRDTLAIRRIMGNVPLGWPIAALMGLREFFAAKKPSHA